MGQSKDWRGGWISQGLCFAGSPLLNEVHIPESRQRLSVPHDYVEGEGPFWHQHHQMVVSISRAGPVPDSISLYLEHSENNTAPVRAHEKVHWMMN